MGDSNEKSIEELQRQDEKLSVELEALKMLATQQTDKQTADNLKKKYIDALHEYNEVKDATQVVLGVLANHEQVTVKQMHQKYDLPTNDGWVRGIWWR